MTSFTGRRCGRRRSGPRAGRAANSSLRTAGIGRPALKPDGGEVARAGGGGPGAVGPPDIVTVLDTFVADILASRPTSPAPSTGFPNGHRKGARPRFGEPPPWPVHSASGAALRRADPAARRPSLRLVRAGRRGDRRGRDRHLAAAGAGALVHP